MRRKDLVAVVNGRAYFQDTIRAMKLWIDMKTRLKAVTQAIMWVDSCSFTNLTVPEICPI